MSNEELNKLQNLRSEKSIELLNLKFEIEDLEKKLDNIKNKIFIDSFKNESLSNEKQRIAYVSLELSNENSYPDYLTFQKEYRIKKLAEKKIQNELDDIHEQIRSLLHLTRNEQF